MESHSKRIIDRLELADRARSLDCGPAVAATGHQVPNLLEVMHVDAR